MSQKKSINKIEEKRALLFERTALALGITRLQSADLLSVQREQSLRINTLLPYPELSRDLEMFVGKYTIPEWCEEGVVIPGGIPLKVRDSSLVRDNYVYIQNAASWLPVVTLDPQPGETILDVCAAPGGKTSHIAARTGNQAAITANDNSRPRLAKLQSNLNRLGVRDVDYTLFDATQLANRMSGRQFDKILLDAPCSGEGMMRLDRDADFTTWSLAQIRRLAQQQKRLLNQSWQLLKPGGTLVYSTCTIAPEENEAVIAYHLRSHADARILPIDLQVDARVPAVAAWNDREFPLEIRDCLRIAPSPSVEAFFVARLTKLDASDIQEYK